MLPSYYLVGCLSVGLSVCLYACQSFCLCLLKTLARQNPASNQFLPTLFWICHAFSAPARPEKEWQIQNKLGRNWFESGFTVLASLIIIVFCQFCQPSRHLRGWTACSVFLLLTFSPRYFYFSTYYEIYKGLNFD